MSLIYKNIVRPFFFKLNPEDAHESVCSFLCLMAKFPFLCDIFRKYNQVKVGKPINLFGLNFPNHIGLAAGMDKNGSFPKASEAFGFGHIEVGTVTPNAQPGNPRPRMFRVEENQAIINRMGFNNNGTNSMLASLEKNFSKKNRRTPLGINIGKAKSTPIDNALDDYLKSFHYLADQADYFTINVSSPNTLNLRKLQSKEELDTLCKEMQKANLGLAKKMGRKPHPLLLKISPDLSFPEIDSILEVLLDYNFSGIIATNTTIQRPIGINIEETGGYSGGAFIQKISTDIVRYISKATSGKLPIIAAGGINDLKSAGEKMDVGASLIQIYTSWIYEGPFFPKKLAVALRNRSEEWI